MFVPSIRPGIPVLISLSLWYSSCGIIGNILDFFQPLVFHFFPVSSSNTALIISFGNFHCANFSGVTFSCATLTYASMDSWVIDLVFACLLRMLWVGASTSFSFSLRWAASRCGRLGITGCDAPGGFTTLGVVTVGDITGVGSVTGLVGCKIRWRLSALRGTGNPTPIFCGSAYFLSPEPPQLQGRV